MNFVQIADFDWWLWQPKGKISEKKKNIQKSSSQKLKLCINVYDISLCIKCVFIAVAHVFSLIWQLKVSIDL